MSSKVFEFSEDGLRYTVTLTQEDGGPVMATITVLEGQMDVNAIYLADGDHSGSSVNLGGPLNMNGAGSSQNNVRIQWDDALELSRPGLGSEGTSKETFLSAEDGNNELGPFYLSSSYNLDEIEYIGVRATSTSTPEGSIKGVASGEDTGDDVDVPDCELPEGTNKVFFALPTDEHPENGIYVRETDLNLEPGQEATLQNYYDVLLSQLESYDLDFQEFLSEIVAYNVSFDDDGNEAITELARFEVGEIVDSDLPLPVICVDEDEALHTDEYEDDSETQLVA